MMLTNRSKLDARCGVRIIFALFSSLCFLFSALYLSGCSKPFYRDKFVICGTYLEITSTDKRAAQIVYEEFKRLNKIFNFYDPESELSRLNNTYNENFKASAELIEILNLAKQLNVMSDGAFDVSYGSIYSFWTELIKNKGASEFPSQDKITELKKNCGMDKIEINTKDKTIAIKQPGLKIDLGAIAEGYMVDKAVIKLKKSGITSAVINAGGDIYCLGTNNGKPWRVGIKNPEEVQYIIDNEDLINEAMTTSGGYEQFFDFNGKRYSHLVSPYTGFPVTGNILSVSVITKNCTTADGFATAFFVSGIEGISKFLSKYPSTMRIFVLFKDTKGKRLQIFR